jgi:hypothetical protein
MPLRARQQVVTVAIALLTLGTSCGADVVLLNRSDSPISVTLEPLRGDSTDPNCRCPDGFIHPRLALAPATDGQKVRTGSWVPVDSTVLQYDSAGIRTDLKIHLTLPPRTALRLGHVRVEGNRVLDAPFWTLELEGAGRHDRYDGGMLGDVFKKRARLLVYEFRS